MLFAIYYLHQFGRSAVLGTGNVKILRACSQLVLCTAILCFPLGGQNYTVAQKIAIPSYFVPGPFWTQMTNSAQYVGIAVANVSNGPDYQPTPEYKAAIRAATAAGIKVLGYVRTGYFGNTGFSTRLGEKDIPSWLGQIEQDVNAWYNFYGSDGLAGIFFDESLNTCSDASLYSYITSYVKQNYTGALIAHNPGAAVPSCYQGTADILLTFEGTYSCYVQDASCYIPLDWNPVDP